MEKQQIMLAWYKTLLKLNYIIFYSTNFIRFLLLLLELEYNDIFLISDLLSVIVDVSKQETKAN